MLSEIDQGEGQLQKDISYVDVKKHNRGITSAQGTELENWSLDRQSNTEAHCDLGIGRAIMTRGVNTEAVVEEVGTLVEGGGCALETLTLTVL